MKMPKSKISDVLIPLFESIVQTYKGDECEEQFMKAMQQHLRRSNVFVY